MRATRRLVLEAAAVVLVTRARRKARTIPRKIPFTVGR